MKCNKDDIIRDGDKLYSVFAVLGSVIYVKSVSDVKGNPVYELEDVLKCYRKIEVMEK